MSCRPYRARGFTLVELMVIISILGLIAAIGVPTFNGYLRANLVDTTADRVASDMALARTLSVSQGRVIQFAGTAGGYQVIDPSDASVIRDRTFEGSVQLDAAYNINFYPWGAADTSTLTLDTGSETRVVQVLPTGIAEVQH